MYDEICRLVLMNSSRLIYTAGRAIGNALNRLKSEYPAFHHEVSINEKVAFELAFTGSIAGKRTACLFSTEGLYEALDPVMSSAYTGVIGGFVILCIQETEEEITPVGLFSKLPLIVAESSVELARALEFGYYLSEKYEIPVLIQATPDADEGRGLKEKPEAGSRKSEAGLSNFVKDHARWAATPKFRYQLHKQLNEKTEKIREEFEQYEGNKTTIHGKTGIITNKREYVEFYAEDTSIMYIASVYPLPVKSVNSFMEQMDEIYIIEGQYPAMELQIRDRTKPRAEHTGFAPKRAKPAEMIYGFTVVRDTFGAASAINMAHGIKKTDPGKKILAITYEDHFLHSGMAAFINTLYNNSSYVLLIMVSEREDEIKKIMEGYGFRNFHHLDNISETEKFKTADELTVLFCKGII